MSCIWNSLKYSFVYLTTEYVGFLFTCLKRSLKIQSSGFRIGHYANCGDIHCQSQLQKSTVTLFAWKVRSYYMSLRVEHYIQGQRLSYFSINITDFSNWPVTNIKNVSKRPVWQKYWSLRYRYLRSALSCVLLLLCVPIFSNISPIIELLILSV